VDAPRQRLVVIGQGYVGLPLATLAADAGYKVVGIDLDASRVGSLRRGEPYVDDVDNSQLHAQIC
jgi:UDP-N-acetyl-D-glucosamine dehydrogenase